MKFCSVERNIKIPFMQKWTFVILTNINYLQRKVKVHLTISFCFFLIIFLLALVTSWGPLRCWAQLVPITASGIEAVRFLSAICLLSPRWDVYYCQTHMWAIQPKFKTVNTCFQEHQSVYSSGKSSEHIWSSTSADPFVVEKLSGTDMSKTSKERMSVAELPLKFC